jgi:hypothetical protein
MVRGSTKQGLAWLAIITGALTLVALLLYAFLLPEDSQAPRPSIFAFGAPVILILMGHNWLRRRQGKPPEPEGDREGRNPQA